MAGGEDPSPGELARVLEGVREGQRDTVTGLHGVEVAMARLEEQFRAHVGAQAGRTAGRNALCRERLDLIRGLDDRVGDLETTQAAGSAVVVESHRSAASIIQALATAGTVAGVAVALWRS
jgi:hypothetical protein